MTFIKKKKIANGITLEFRDGSKTITGDRWSVRLCCEISFPLTAGMEDEIARCGAAKDYVQGRMNGVLRHELAWERNFVDETDKDKCLDELLARAGDISAYLANDEFLNRLFHKRIAELEEAYICRNEPADQVQTVDEPADFSACFR